MANKRTRSSVPWELHLSARYAPRPALAIQPPLQLPHGYLNYAEYAEAEITPGLCGLFDALLFTYHIRELRGEVAIPRIDDRLRDWRLECEEQYGDGRYVERRHLLYGTLGKVIHFRHGDPKAIYTALVETRRAAMEAAGGGRAIDLRRKLVEEHGKLRDHLEYWAKQLQRWFRETEGAGVGFSAENGEMAELVRHLDALLESLSTDPFVRTPVRPSLHRRRSDYQQPPWLIQAHRELARAGVRRQTDREHLLMAVGLIPYDEHFLPSNGAASSKQSLSSLRSATHYGKS